MTPASAWLYSFANWKRNQERRLVIPWWCMNMGDIGEGVQGRWFGSRGCITTTWGQRFIGLEKARTEKRRKWKWFRLGAGLGGGGGKGGGGVKSVKYSCFFFNSAANKLHHYYYTPEKTKETNREEGAVTAEGLTYLAMTWSFLTPEANKEHGDS